MLSRVTSTAFLALCVALVHNARLMCLFVCVYVCHALGAAGICSSHADALVVLLMTGGVHSWHSYSLLPC